MSADLNASSGAHTAPPADLYGVAFAAAGVMALARGHGHLAKWGDQQITYKCNLIPGPIR